MSVEDVQGVCCQSAGGTTSAGPPTTWPGKWCAREEAHQVPSPSTLPGQDTRHGRGATTWVHDQLGKGGHGALCTRRGTSGWDRVVAIKMLPPSATNSPEAVERFQREVRAAARLSHPNIVAAFDADEADGMYLPG